MPQKITPYKNKTPRLTANIGILIANNRRTDLMERFMAMMDFCCQQIRHLDKNGMYREPGSPFVYDLATRGLFAVLLHEGYQGKYKDVWQKALARSAIPTLEMISRK